VIYGKFFILSSFAGSRDGVNSTVTAVRSGRPRSRYSFPGRSKRYVSTSKSPCRLVGQPAFDSLSIWNPIIYNKPTRCNSGSIVFIKNYKYALRVSDVLCVHHQEHYKLQQQPLYSAQPTLNFYTGFIPSQLMTNISGCCYSL